MIAIFSIIIDKNSELINTFLESTATTVANTKNIKRIKETIIITNNESVHSFFKKENKKTVLKPDFDLIKSHENVFNILKICSDDFISSDTEDILFINSKNQNISTETIEKAIETYYSKNSKGLISVAKPVDHPCQLYSYYKIINNGFLYFLDRSESVNKILTDNIQTIGLSDDFIVTKPFFFNWQKRDIKADKKKRLFIRNFADNKIVYLPINERKTDLENLSPIYFYETADTARIIFQKNFMEKKINESSIKAGLPDIYGVSFSNGFNSISLICVSIKSETSEKTFLHINREKSEENEQGLFLRYIESEIPHKKNHNKTEYDIPESRKNKCFEIDKVSNNCSGLIYSILQNSESGCFDIKEPFQTNKKLWDIDKKSLKPKNIESGKEFTGRQDFPDIFEIEGSIIITKKSITPVFKEELLSGNIDGFQFKKGL